MSDLEQTGLDLDPSVEASVEVDATCPHARCLYDAIHEPVLEIARVLDDLIDDVQSESSTSTWLDAVSVCIWSGRRAFWLAPVKGGQFIARTDPFAFDTHLLAYAHAICAPRSCSVQSIGHWFAAAAMTLSAAPKVASVLHAVRAAQPILSGSMWCHDGSWSWFCGQAPITALHWPSAIISCAEPANEENVAGCALL